MTKKEITNEEREHRYQNASEPIQRLYNDEECGEVLHSIFSRHNLAEEKYKPYVVSVGDVILGFYQKHELPGLLENSMTITPERALKIAEDLNDFLVPVKQSPEPKPEQPYTQTTKGTGKQKVLPADQTPRYRRPLTRTPRYDGKDPYRELPEP